jgi:hypothetical protein
MYGIYNSICSLATTTAAAIVADWFPAFVCSPFQLRFEEDMIVEGLLLGLAALLDDDDVDC